MASGAGLPGDDAMSADKGALRLHAADARIVKHRDDDERDGLICHLSMYMAYCFTAISRRFSRRLPRYFSRAFSDEMLIS